MVLSMFVSFLALFGAVKANVDKFLMEDLLLQIVLGEDYMADLLKKDLDPDKILHEKIAELTKKMEVRVAKSIKKKKELINTLLVLARRQMMGGLS